LKQCKEYEKFQAILVDISKSMNISILYPADNPAYSMLSPIGYKAFKIIQNKGCLKLITYYQF
jgi:hypothetical protein